MAGVEPRPVVLRGSTLVSAPFTLVGIVALAVCGFSVAWSFGSSTGAAAPGLLTAACFAALGAVALVAARGCRVVLDGSAVRDQVAWFTIWSSAPTELAEVRVRAGPWRTFEVETLDGARHVLLGVGPVQFPASLGADAAERNQHVVDSLRSAWDPEGHG